MKNPPPPKHLSAEARRWYRALSADYDISDPAGALLLQTACEAFDRMRGAQAAIEADGATSTDRFGQRKAHPLLSVERDARAQMIAALKALNLDLEPVKSGPGRPSGR